MEEIYHGWTIRYEEGHEQFHATKGNTEDVIALVHKSLKELKILCDKTDKKQGKKKFEKIPVLYPDVSNDDGYVKAEITSVAGLSRSGRVEIWVSYEKIIGCNNRGRHSTNDFVLDTPENREKLKEMHNLHDKSLRIEMSLTKINNEKLKEFIA